MFSASSTEPSTWEFNVSLLNEYDFRLGGWNGEWGLSEVGGVEAGRIWEGRVSGRHRKEVCKATCAWVVGPSDPGQILSSAWPLRSCRMSSQALKAPSQADLGLGLAVTK